MNETGENASAAQPDPAHVIADLRELAALTSDENGAQRLAWSPEWTMAREWMQGKLEEIGLEAERDEAGNVWSYLDGDSEPALTLGSHIDSVPDGGWLDGALGLMAALGVVRAWAQSGQRPPRTIALVDWADEEGARFGRSLYGSAAVAGTLDPAELADAVDARGGKAREVLAECGIDLDEAPKAASRLERMYALLELHIEQGPVLELEGTMTAAVSGTAGVERYHFVFNGQAGHAGTTPMKERRDAGLAAAESALMIEHLGVEYTGMATTGSIALSPGIITAVAGRAELGVDLRHAEVRSLTKMLGAAKNIAQRVARKRGCTVTFEHVWSIEPRRFDSRLVSFARRSCRDAGGSDRLILSGALHDAAEISTVCPAAMIFAPSIAGISHAKEENTSDEDLATAIEAYGGLVARALTR